MKKILVLNSDPDTMELLQDLLQIRGFEVEFNAVKEDVPAILKRFKPNLVLLDITRHDEMEELKRDADAEDVPILMMTGYNNYPFKLDRDFKYVIIKPFTMEELMQKIESVPLKRTT